MHLQNLFNLHIIHHKKSISQSLNIVESGIKYHKPTNKSRNYKNKIFIHFLLQLNIFDYNNFCKPV